MTLTDCLAAAKEIDRLYLETNCLKAERNERGLSYEHLRWMVLEMHNGMSIGKAMRWLGYIQGVLVATAVCTLEDMKNLSKRHSEGQQQ